MKISMTKHDYVLYFNRKILQTNADLVVSHGEDWFAFKVFCLTELDILHSLICDSTQMCSRILVSTHG